MCHCSPHGFPVTDRPVTEQCALTPAFHSPINSHQLTTTQWRIQKLCLHGVWHVCSVQDFEAQVILLPEFSPSSALLSNGNLFHQHGLRAAHWGAGRGKGDQSISKLKRQITGKFTSSSCFLLLYFT